MYWITGLDTHTPTAQAVRLSWTQPDTPLLQSRNRFTKLCQRRGGVIQFKSLRKERKDVVKTAKKGFNKDWDRRFFLQDDDNLKKNEWDELMMQGKRYIRQLKQHKSPNIVYQNLNLFFLWKLQLIIQITAFFINICIHFCNVFLRRLFFVF